ncbi:MAG: 50S ribosomal protein L3, partial [Anaerolineae bacterium]|nr:50S ribosomal protein L3 [Anaerolineae bacterium]
MKSLLARKIGMTQMFNEQGEVVPVTVLRAGPCYVTQLRTPERDGYAAI